MQFLAMDEKTYVSTNVTLLAPWLRGALNRSKAISVRIHAKRRNRNSFTKKACLEKRDNFSADLHPASFSDERFC
jgi:hypothetical protein